MNSTLEQQYLLFRVGEILACFNLAETLSVINPPKMIRLQSARGSIIRAFRHQDELGAVVSMQIKFGQPEQKDYSAGKLILGRINGRLAGFWVDEVLGITRLSDPIEVEDEQLAQEIDHAAIDKVVVHREQRYLHLAMQPFMQFENPQQILQWIHKKHLEWQERDLHKQEEELERQRQAQHEKILEKQEKMNEFLEQQIETMYLDPEVTLEYAHGLLEVAEYNEQQRLEEEAAKVAAEVEAEAEAAAAAAREADITLPDLGQVEAGAEPMTETAAPDAVFEEELPKPEKRKRKILWGAARRTGTSTAPRRFKSIKELRPGLTAVLKRWGNRLVWLTVIACVVLIFKTIQPMLFQQIVDAIQNVFNSAELGQTWDRLWHKIASLTGK